MDKDTLFLKVDPERPDKEIIGQAGLILRKGGLVAFPTETVYGLGASALDSRAVAGIFQAKGRPQDNPLIVHVADYAAVEKLASTVPPGARKLMKAYWPGPLTLVLPGGRNVCPEVAAGLDTVAVRMPAHPVALDLIKAAGVPVAAPSANLSGRPSPTTARHVRSDLDGKIDAILDGGAAGMGVESTVVDMTGDTPVVLRPGGVTPQDLERVVGAVSLDPAVDVAGVPEAEKPRSPGMKYKHYAPLAPVILVEGEPQRVAGQIRQLADKHTAEGRRVGILACSGTREIYPRGELLLAAQRGEPLSAAKNLYDLLRRFDEMGVDIILAEGVEPKGVGLAVMNRLRRAAGNNILRV